MSQPLHIAYFTHYADLYGANRSLLDLIVQLRDQGNVVPYVIMANAGPLELRSKSAGIACTVIPFSTWMEKRVYMGGLHHRFTQWLGYQKSARARLRQDRSLLPQLEELLREQKIDLLHVNSSVIGIGHLLKQRMKIPLIWHIRELVFKHYGLHPDVGVKGFHRAFRAADRVIAISNAVKEELQIAVAGSSRQVVIYNGIINDDEYRLRSAEVKVRDHQPFTFTLIGYFHRSKGQIEAIEAFAEVRKQFPGIKLLIAGSGNDTQIRKTVDVLGISADVEFAGFVNDTDLIYERTNVLLNCSRFEALGRVTIEAMFHKIPVIGHASGATPEIIQHGETGSLYSTRSELVNYMIEMAADPARAQKIGLAAFRSLGERFSIKARAKDVLQVYHDVIGARK